MRSVSNDFKKVIADGGPFYAFARIELANGEALELTSQDDFYVSGNSYAYSCSGKFPLGEAVCKTISIGLNNVNDKFSEYDFYKAKIILFTEIDKSDGTIERLQEGIFTVIDAVAPGDVIDITAYDNMHKSDRDFTSTLIYPATLDQLLREVCDLCDITINTRFYPHKDDSILNAPEKATARQIIGDIAQWAGGNAYINSNGELVIKTYNQAQTQENSIVSGGNFKEYISNSISGGQFGEDITDIINGSEFGSLTNKTILSQFSTDPDIATDDITITGVSTDIKVNNETTEIIYGDEEYVLKITNSLIAGKEEEVLQIIGDTVIGITVRPFSGEFFPNPTLEFMDDVFVIDRKDNIYQSFITSHTFTYLGSSEFSNDTETPAKNEAKYQSSAGAVYQQVKKDLKEDKSSWQQAVEELNQDLQNASGLYQTTEIQPDGSSIYYFHDKKTLAESGVVIKITAQAMGISTDGGKTYPTGITVDGEAIVKILQTVGINADWITTGTLKVGGVDNQSGQIAIYDENDNPIGNIDNSGIEMFSGGQIISSSGDDNARILHDRLIFEYSNSTADIVFGGTLFINSSNTIEIGIGDYTSHETYIEINQTDAEGYIGIRKPINLYGHSIYSAGNIYNAALQGVTIDNSLDIYNDTTVNIYSDINMNKWTINNVKIGSLVAIGNTKPYSGTIPIITSITANASGGISWTSSSIVVQDGIIVSGP